VNQDLNRQAREAGNGIRDIFFEALIVALTGGILALTANAISPRGLSLVRNYFPGSIGGSIAVPVPAASASGTNSTNGLSAAQSAAAQIEAEGLHVVETGRAAGLFQSPGFHQGLVVFVDARDEEHFRQGHIPGAYEFDTYHPEKYLGDVLPVCQAAEQIVVYCHGGDCEDSRFAAKTLHDAGIPNEKLFVFVGGITEWQANKLPMERGERNSGDIQNTPP
jgi:rhodanese-related sulfurtransferase